jgi:hypothetical protein
MPILSILQSRGAGRLVLPLTGPDEGVVHGYYFHPPLQILRSRSLTLKTDSSYVNKQPRIKIIGASIIHLPGRIPTYRCTD